MEGGVMARRIPLGGPRVLHDVRTRGMGCFGSRDSQGRARIRSSPSSSSSRLTGQHRRSWSGLGIVLRSCQSGSARLADAFGRDAEEITGVVTGVGRATSTPGKGEQGAHIRNGRGRRVRRGVSCSWSAGSPREPGSPSGQDDSSQGVRVEVGRASVPEHVERRHTRCMAGARGRCLCTCSWIEKCVNSFCGRPRPESTPGDELAEPSLARPTQGVPASVSSGN
ncbi:hypothetical protein CBR_g78102 [Chara braunii]|uniref:Uncharacterized protein n=1 Tax=Chara braunii TaxID=69332 RepID=A0A388JKC1_CHABU|nr:hypothetical protein CBR_g78102 [Chara braunii]|eukprot:GBG44632.1 hypothetical protein CBR_g78102 [Chara braunii]